MLTASFKSWAPPAQIIRVGGRSTGSSANETLPISWRDVRLKDVARFSPEKTVARYVTISDRVFHVDRARSEFAIFSLRISEEFQRFYSSCLSHDSVEAWMKSYRPILASGDKPADQVNRVTNQRRSATA